MGSRGNRVAETRGAEHIIGIGDGEEEPEEEEEQCSVSG